MLSVQFTGSNVHVFSAFVCQEFTIEAKMYSAAGSESCRMGREVVCTSRVDNRFANKSYSNDVVFVCGMQSRCNKLIDRRHRLLVLITDCVSTGADNLLLL